MLPLQKDGLLSYHKHEINIIVMYLLLEKQKQLWTVDLLVDSDWSAEGQTVTDNQNEHTQCPITAQLVCNEVALVNRATRSVVWWQ